MKSGDPCDSRDPRSPMNPLAGIRATHRTTYGYREASPDGDSLPFRITATHPVVPQPIMNYESCIMNYKPFLISLPSANHQIRTGAFLLL